jgi:hypothetical protein
MDENEIRKCIADEMAKLAKSQDSAIVLAVKDAVREGYDGLVAQIAKVEKLAEAKGQAGLTKEDVASIVKAQVGEALASHQKEQAEADKTAEADAATKKAVADYVAAKMKGVPAAYAALMPNTADAAELEKAEKAVRERMKTELTSVGAKLPDVGANSNGQGGPADSAAGDNEKSGGQLLKEAYGAEGGAK